MRSKQKIYIKPVGTVRPCNKRDNHRVFVPNQKNYILLFTIKKKHAVASCPRVSTSQLYSITELLCRYPYSSPNSLREYWYKSRTNS